MLGIYDKMANFVTIFALFVASNSFLVDANFADKGDVANEKHMKKHLEDEIDVNDEWSAEERRFHYFQMNDLDEDMVINGMEVIAAVVHQHEENEGQEEDHHGGLNESANAKVFTDAELENEVDPIMKDMDLNGDGLIDYSEYSKKVDL